ncbi:hypothetical protein C8Q76DRAFT_698122 [Earliella scabrosa]|nr:hypothetical protein C8Q76DRAFT_698122 [Earliella scabrosa]
MHTHLDVALDARIVGDKSRFVRNDCRPNAILRPIFCQLKPAARRTTRKRSCCEWDDDNFVQSRPSLIRSPFESRLSCSSAQGLPPKQAPSYPPLPRVDDLDTTCGCGAKAQDCGLTRLAEFVESHTPRLPPETVGKSSKTSWAKAKATGKEREKEEPAKEESAKEKGKGMGQSRAKEKPKPEPANHAAARPHTPAMVQEQHGLPVLKPSLLRSLLLPILATLTAVTTPHAWPCSASSSHPPPHADSTGSWCFGRGYYQPVSGCSLFEGSCDDTFQVEHTTVEDDSQVRPTSLGCRSFTGPPLEPHARMHPSSIDFPNPRLPHDSQPAVESSPASIPALPPPQRSSPDPRPDPEHATAIPVKVKLSFKDVVVRQEQ